MRIVRRSRPRPGAEVRPFARSGAGDA
jgi:hypothetical protein